MAANEYEAFLAKVAAQYGVARVALDRIWFDEMADDSRTLDPAHVSRLLQLFQQGQCDRLDPDHYLSAVISDQLLHRVLERAQLSIESLRLTEPPFLPLRGEEYLVGIDGLHRHQAAVQYFSNRPERDRWWIVKLYDDRALPPATRKTISLSSTNAKPFSPGEIYRQMQRARHDGDWEWVHVWQSRLRSPVIRYDLDRLQRLARYEKFRVALDDLLPFRGLWVDCPMSWRHIYALNCREESTEYLRHTREVLSTVLDGLDPRYLDAQSVRLLQGRCPAWSRVDQAHVHAQFQAGKVFAAVVDHTERSDLEARLMTVDTMFPSLQTWIEAIGVLEAGAPVLKKLLPTKSHICTLQQEAFRSFRTARRPSRSQRRSWESTRDLFWAAYRQLWLVALRYSRGAHRAPSTRVLRTVARQAHELGFDSPAINQYMSSPPLASETVPSFEPCATASPLTAAIVNDQTTPSVARRTRLSPRVLRQSQRYLTLDRVYSDVPVAAGQTLTAFGIVRDVLRVCFHHRAMWIAGPMPSRFMSSGFMPSTPTPSRSTPSRPTPSLPSRLLHTRSHWSDQSIRMIANGPYDGHHSQEPTGRVLSSMSQARPLSRTASSGSQYSRDSPWEARPVHKSPGSQPPRVSEDTRQPRPLLLTHIPAENHVIRATRASLVHTLQGRECNQTPSQAQSQLTTRSPDASAVVYHYASPAMLYELPAAQAQQLFADRIVAQGERQWYAIWDDNRLKPFAPCQIVQYLGSKVIIYGDANSFHRAQQDQLP